MRRMAQTLAFFLKKGYNMRIKVRVATAREVSPNGTLSVNERSFSCGVVARPLQNEIPMPLMNANKWGMYALNKRVHGYSLADLSFSGGFYYVQYKS